ncbi:hypothetical protein NtB2_01560 [Lactococcus termiticola]|uniref:Regulator of the mannose operon, ManO n=1 Tax=Lactococcus termiticola TaxID=2169526 RepID=A0A2R5HIK2_9LACT|nr:hypothetical protein NtB2_01560 [Lactococcus termiticola]
MVSEAISYLGLPKYGKLMLGDRGIEFFSDRNVADNMTFPWESIGALEGRVIRKKKIGRNFTIVLQNKSKVRFSSKEAGKVLKVAREHLGDEKVVRSQTFIGGVKNIPGNFIALFNKKDKLDV